MIVSITITDNKNSENKIIGFVANFEANEGEFNANTSIEIALDEPADSLTLGEKISRLNIKDAIESLKESLISQGANITKLKIIF